MTFETNLVDGTASIIYVRRGLTRSHCLTFSGQS